MYPFLLLKLLIKAPKPTNNDLPTKLAGEGSALFQAKSGYWMDREGNGRTREEYDSRDNFF